MHKYYSAKLYELKFPLYATIVTFLIMNLLFKINLLQVLPIELRSNNKFDIQTKQNIHQITE